MISKKLALPDLLNLTSDWYWELDANLRFLTNVDRDHHISGPADDPVGKFLDELPFLDASTIERGEYKKVLESHLPFRNLALRLKAEDGSLRHVHLSGMPVHDDQGNFNGYCGISRNVTELINATGRLSESEARFRALTELSSDWYWEQDEEFRFISRVGRDYKAVVPQNQFIGKRRWELPYLDITEEQWEEHKATLYAHKPFRDFVLKMEKKEGGLRYISLSGEPVFDGNGTFTGYRGVGRDITERTLAEERINHMAKHDSLTALPNRFLFSELLNFAIEHGKRYSRQFALLFIDLDRFKIINDTLGHDAGDSLLREVAQRLSQAVRSSDIVARLGGDEFVVLVQEVSEANEVEAVARKIILSLSRPILIKNQECRVTASVGVCMYPKDALDEQSLMTNADAAMYRAKERGKNTFQFYSEEMHSHSLERLAFESSLRRALERNEFFLHYQAKVDAGTNRITGVEALLRWQHPDLGVIDATRILPVAEETGLVIPIGKWVLQTACAQNVAWQTGGLAPVSIAVNLSARQLCDENILIDIESILKQTGMDPRLLELDITETTVIQNLSRADLVFSALKDMGIRLAIDDFGAGFTALTYLKRYRFDILKIGQSFVSAISGDPAEDGLAEVIIAMGKSLKLTVVAEGVETESQASFLRTHACDEMQGFYFNKPGTCEQVSELFTRSPKTRK